MGKKKDRRRARERAEELPVRLPKPWQVTDTLLERSRRKLVKQGSIPVAFDVSAQLHPPSAVPPGMAMDEAIIETNVWAAQQVFAGAFFNGVTFMGYPYLAELAQRPEYRRISEVPATEMTRKWIKFRSTSGDDEAKAERIKQLDDELDRLDVQGAFRKTTETDGFFGRGHIYLDTGDTDDRDELVTSIGDGVDAVSDAKFAGRTGFLKAVRPVEPVWCYPAKYDALDPLKKDWYNPQSWYVQGKELHVTRLLTFIGREVPDMLKPSYSFGGLSRSQMAKPYVDNWLRTRQAVGDLVVSFSVKGIKTDMTAVESEDGHEIFNRLALFANWADNQGMMVLNKDDEEFFNITTPLSSLNDLQAQSQEHMCSVVGVPVVKLLGIQPAGLNASSEGELTVFYDNIEAEQHKFYDRHLETVINFTMRSLWGAVDPDITFIYESLRSPSEKERSEMKKAVIDGDVSLVGAGILDPVEVRTKMANDPESGYDGLIDPDDVPEGPPGEEQQPGNETQLPGGGANSGLGERDEGALGERADRGRGEGDDRREDDPGRDGREDDPARGGREDGDRNRGPRSRSWGREAADA